MPRKKKEEVEEIKAEVSETEAVEETAVETKAAEETAETAEAAVADEKPKKEAKKKAKKKSSPAKTDVSASDDASKAEKGAKRSKRAEKIGVVQSDKMTKTVTVRVDRVVKHPVYRKYVKRRKNFMAHDEMGATIGDKVRIIETRPLSARKRWRVVEIIQKAEK